MQIQKKISTTKKSKFKKMGHKIEFIREIPFERGFFSEMKWHTRFISILQKYKHQNLFIVSFIALRNKFIIIAMLPTGLQNTIHI